MFNNLLQWGMVTVYVTTHIAHNLQRIIKCKLTHRMLLLVFAEFLKFISNLLISDCNFDVNVVRYFHICKTKVEQ